ERMHRSLMSFLHPYTFSAVQVPPAQPAVTASTDQQLPTWDPAQRRDHPRMPHKGMYTLSAVAIPHEQLPAVSLPLTAATRGQPGAIGTPGHTHDGPLMPRQRLEQPAIGGVPHIDVAIIAPGDQAGATTLSVVCGQGEQRGQVIGGR